MEQRPVSPRWKGPWSGRAPTMPESRPASTGPPDHCPSKSASPRKTSGATKHSSVSIAQTNEDADESTFPNVPVLRIRTLAIGQPAAKAMQALRPNRAHLAYFGTTQKPTEAGGETDAQLGIVPSPPDAPTTPPSRAPRRGSQGDF